MKKETLEKFIGKYYLAGAIESVIWKSNGSLDCDFVNESQDLIGKVVLSKNPMDKGDLGIYKTSQLSKILTALDEEIDVKFDGDASQSVSISLKDKSNKKAKFMLADPSVIQKSPDLKTLPEWDIELDIDDKFIGDFIKSRNAVPDATTFSIVTAGNTVQFIINYSSIGTNRVTFECTPTKITDTPAVAFKADLFKEVLVANKGMKGILKVSSKGLMNLTFTDGEFVTSYFMVKQTIS
jgi:hypothetical protein